MSATRQEMNPTTIVQLIAQHVADAITADEANRTSEVDLTMKRVEGLTDDIQGNVTSSKPKSIGEAIRMAHDLMDQVVRAKAVRNGENKMK
ncbi:hypothetical protein Tco_0436801 [Tanacetum coccineum]